MKSIVKKPWGSFEVLEEGEKYTLKRINVSPKGVLSLQRHQHRSEHWIIVEGQAEVRIDDKTYNLKANETIFIPKGSKHRLSNKSLNNLVVIEVWFGDKLDENDIERFEDLYGRYNVN
tara:strand:- start:163 stop:516 length:354 start_codon:yes stop_codon:yes gene_type:complete